MIEKKIETKCVHCGKPICEGDPRTRIGGKDYCEIPASCYLKFLEQRGAEACPNETRFNMSLKGTFLIDRDEVRRIA